MSTKDTILHLNGLGGKHKAKDIKMSTGESVQEHLDGVSGAIQHLEETKLDVSALLSSNIILYPTSVASDIGGYFKMVTSTGDVDYNTTAIDISTGEIATQNQLIASLSTTAGLLIGNTGIINIVTIGSIKRTGGGGQALFYYNLYRRDLTGTETLICTSNETNTVDISTYTEFSATALLNDGTWTNTDRIVIKYYGSKIVGSGSNPTYDFQFGGSLPIRTLLPVSVSVIPTDTSNLVHKAGDETISDNKNFSGKVGIGLSSPETFLDIGLFGKYDGQKAFKLWGGDISTGPDLVRSSSYIQYGQSYVNGPDAVYGALEFDQIIENSGPDAVYKTYRFKGEDSTKDIAISQGNIIFGNGSQQSVAAEDNIKFLGSVSGGGTNYEFNFSGTYSKYIIEFNNVVPVTNNVSFRTTLKYDGAYETGATAYRFALLGRDDTGKQAASNSTRAAAMLLAYGVSNNSSYGITGKVEVIAPSVTGKYKTLDISTACYDGTVYKFLKGSGILVASTSALQAIKFDFSSGDISSGTIKIYGVK